MTLSHEFSQVAHVVEDYSRDTKDMMGISKAMQFEKEMSVLVAGCS